MADNVLAQVPRKRYPTLDEQMRSDIVNYLSRLKSDFVTSGERAGQGLGQVIDDGNYLEGVPRVVLGGLGAIGAPVSAAVSPVLGPLLQPVGQAVDTYVGQPVERATGYPADITNELFLTGVTAGAAPVLRPVLRGSGNFLAKVGDAAEAGLNRVGYTARPQEGVRFTFGGPMALTADKAKLAQAQKMAADGLSRDEIWKRTGWFEGDDGKWRFEISDDAASVTGAGQTVGQALRHDELFAAYPDLRNVDFESTSGPEAGMYIARGLPDGERIRASETNQQSVMMHELQHAIQEREGFAGGGNMDWGGGEGAYEKYLGIPGEVEARNVQFRMGLTPEKRQLLHPFDTADKGIKNTWVAELDNIISWNNGRENAAKYLQDEIARHEANFQNIRSKPPRRVEGADDDWWNSELRRWQERQDRSQAAKTQAETMLRYLEAGY